MAGSGLQGNEAWPLGWFLVGIFQKASHESRTEGWGLHRVSPAWSQLEGAENLHVFSCSTSGPRDCHMCQHRCPCPCTSVSLTPSSLVCLGKPVMLWGQALGVGTVSHHSHHLTMQPPDAQAHTRLLGPRTLSSCPSGCLEAQGSPGELRTPAEPGQSWRGGAHQTGCERPLGCRAFIGHGDKQSLAGGSGGFQGCRCLVFCMVLRTRAWYTVPSAQCLVLGVCCFTHCHHPLSLPAAQYQCVLPILEPVHGAGAQCLAHHMLCWYQWVATVPVLVSVPGPGDSAQYHCLMCGVWHTLCGAGARA